MEYDINHFALIYVSQNIDVSSCEIYAIPRRVFGLYFDYVFYDSTGKLSGYHRRWVD